MNIFMTGATGNVGQAVTPILLDQGHSLTVLVRKRSDMRGCRIVIGELERIDRFAREIAACDAIVHLARPRAAERSVVLGQDITGTAGLIEAWRNGVFLYTSSSSVYGYPFGALNEQARIELWNRYARKKYANELQLRLAERSNGRRGAVILRAALIFAINREHRGRQFLDEVYKQCRLGSRFVFESEQSLATYGCAFIGGADFGRVVDVALTRDISGIYNIAGGFCTWRELVETFNRVAGTKAEFVVRADGRPQAGEYRLPQSRTELDTTAFANAAGFAAKETLEELVETFVRAERASALA